jgi:thermolysin
MTHARFQQHVRGVPVVGAELAAHFDPAGRLASIDANYIPDVEGVDLEPKLDAKVAADVARQDVLATMPGVDANEVHVGEGKLVVFALNGHPATLAYEVTTRAMTGEHPAIWVTTIDAKSGRVIDRYDNLQTIEATGTGVLGDAKKFQVTQSGGTYVMTDTSRGVSIRTYTANGQQVEAGGGAQQVTSTSLTTWDTAATGPGAAVDAHVYAGVVYDYYKTKHGRNAIDGQGGAMLSTAHYGQAFDNAAWDGTGMIYGDGGRLFKPLSAGLDVVAHEFTHGVTERTSGLRYQNQTGALNESVSDIFGVFIEHSQKPSDTNNWIMGESIAKGAGLIRDFKNPAAGRQPANMSAYVNTQQDNGGVHINSGIPNNAMFLMTVGGTNPVSKTQVAFGIGWEKSEKVWYRTNTKYLLQTSTFAQAAQATMQAAKDLQLTDNEQNIIDCAWKATGVVQGTCATITNPQGTTPPTGTPGDPNGDGTGNGTGDGAGDGTGDGTDGTGDGTGAGAKKPKRGLSAADDSSGCNLSSRSTDLGPLAGVAAAVVGLALGRRRRRR